jgi:hypothetical protein
MAILGTPNWMVRSRKATLSAVMVVLCASFTCQAADVFAPSAGSPPFRYQYLGRMEVEGRLTVHLTRDDKLYPVGVGDVLDAAFRVEGIKVDGLEVTYLPLKRKQFVAFSTIAPPTPSRAGAPARPEALPSQQPVASLPTPPADSAVPAVPRGSVETGSGTESAASGAPGGGLLSMPPVSPDSAAPWSGGAPAAPAAARPGQAESGPPAMPISAPTAEMPVGVPTISSMPTLPGGGDMPAPPPAGANVANTPPVGGP